MQAEKEKAEREAEEARLAEEKAKKEKNAKALEEEKARAKQVAAEKEKKAKLGSIQSMSESKRQDMILRAEAEIAMAEAELKMLDVQMNDPAVQSDPDRSAAIAAEYAAKEEEIMKRYEKWEQLTDGA